MNSFTIISIDINTKQSLVIVVRLNESYCLESMDFK
jgi:hypothetical protein